jgi:hypothetical protein
VFDSQTWLDEHFESVLHQAFVEHYDFPKSTGIFVIASGRIDLESLNDMMKIGKLSLRKPMHALKFKSHDPIFKTMYVITSFSSLASVLDSLKHVARSDADFYDHLERLSKRVSA